MYTISSKSDEIFILARICYNLDFRYKIFKYQCRIPIQHLQIEVSKLGFKPSLKSSFPSKSVEIFFWDHICPNFDFNGL